MAMTAAIGMALAMFSWWSALHEKAGDREFSRLYEGPADVDANSGYILPEWIPNSPLRIISLDFVLDDLHRMPTEDIMFYSQFDCVHTIRIPNYPRISDRVLRALSALPNLETVLVDTNCSMLSVDQHGSETYHAVKTQRIGSLNFKVTDRAFDLIYDDG